VYSIETFEVSVEVEDSIELDVVSKIVGKIVDSLESMVGLVTNVDSSFRFVENSGEIDVLLSLSSVDDRLFSNTSEVVVMT
jgi:hypothetical protein